MDGIINCSSAVKCVQHGNGSIYYIPLDSEELEAHNTQMKEQGFVLNHLYDCYILDGYGAYMGNSDNDNLDEFYWKSFRQRGYDLVIGPKAEAYTCGNYGVFCKNYEEVYKMNHDNSMMEEKQGIIVKLRRVFKKAQ